MIVLKAKEAVFLGFILFLVLGVGAAGVSRADDWEQAVKAAGRETKVVVSIPSSAALRKGLEPTFEKRFSGIDLEPVPGRGSKNIKRIADEHKAGVRYFDAHIGGSQSMLTGLVFGKSGIVKPVAEYFILDQVKDPRNWWGGHMYADRAGKFAYSFQAYVSKNMWHNPNLVDPKEVPSYDSLLDPKWKGKIAFRDPRIPGAGNSVWAYLWQIKGEDYLEKLLEQDLLIVRNNRQIAEALAKGKVAVSMGVTYNTFLPFIEAGLPVKPLPDMKEGTYGSSGHGNLAVLAEGPHPNAAKIFVNWFLGPEGQEIFTRAMGQPTRRLDVDTAWTHAYGYKPAKDFLTVEEYERVENQSEDRIRNVRTPATHFARKVIHR